MLLVVCGFPQEVTCVPGVESGWLVSTNLDRSRAGLVVLRVRDLSLEARAIKGRVVIY